MSVELTVTIKDEEGKRLSSPFNIYETFSMSADDPTIMRYVKEIRDEFKGEVDTIQIKAMMVLK